MTAIRAAAAEELYADGEGQDGDTIDGWTLVGGAQDHKGRQSRWHQRYWLIVRDHEDACWGLGYGIGLTEMQENDFPWDPGYGAADPNKMLPLTRLYPHSVTTTVYKTEPAEVTA
jgi:hypothetical protein